MNRHRIARALRIVCLAGMAVTPLALANGGIIKCIAPGGHITLTDTACPAGERSVTLLPGAQDARAAHTGRALPALLPRHSAARVPVTRLDPPSRSLRRDVMTLKAARQAMLLMDGAAESLHQGRVAGLR